MHVYFSWTIFSLTIFFSHFSLFVLETGFHVSQTGFELFYSWGWPWTPDPLVSISPVLDLQVGAATPGMWLAGAYTQNLSGHCPRWATAPAFNSFETSCLYIDSDRLWFGLILVVPSCALAFTASELNTAVENLAQLVRLLVSGCWSLPQSKDVRTKMLNILELPSVFCLVSVCKLSLVP